MLTPPHAPYIPNLYVVAAKTAASSNFPCTHSVHIRKQALVTITPPAKSSGSGLVHCQVVVPLPGATPGNKVVMVGSVPQLGSWDPRKGLQLIAGPDQVGGPVEIVCSPGHVQGACCTILQHLSPHSASTGTQYHYASHLRFGALKQQLVRACCRCAVGRWSFLRASRLRPRYVLCDHFT